jgi:hypothetical protein
MAPRIALPPIPSLVHLVSRDETPEQQLSDQQKLTPTLVAGIIVIAALAFGIALFVLIRHLRKKASAQRNDERGAAFLNVRGLVKEDDRKRCVSCRVLVRAHTHIYPTAATASP